MTRADQSNTARAWYPRVRSALEQRAASAGDLVDGGPVEIPRPLRSLCVALALADLGDWVAAATTARAVALRADTPVDQAAAAAQLVAVAGDPAESIACVEAIAERAVGVDRGVLLGQRSSVQRALGRFSDAMLSLERANAVDDRGVVHVRRALELAASIGDHAAARTHADRLAALDPRSMVPFAHRARIGRERGDPAEARQAALGAFERGSDARAAAEALLLCRSCGAFDARATGGPHAYRAGCHEVELALWRGELAVALDSIVRTERLDPLHAVLDAPRGIVACLEGRFPDAMTHLDRAIALAPTDPALFLWRAEAAVALARVADARADVVRAGNLSESNTDYVAQQAMLYLCDAITRTSSEVPTPTLDGTDPLLHAADMLVPKGRARLESGRRDEVVSALRELLSRLRGNRTPWPTWVDPQTGLLARLWLPRSLRGQSKDLAWSIRWQAPEAALRAMDELVAANPAAVHPCTYRGELLLWLGQPARALSDFERVLAFREATPWAYIGGAQAELMLDRPDEALAWCQRAGKSAGGPGPPLRGVLGETLRRLGRLDEAVAVLSEATELQPTRVAAWINLALAHAALGNAAAARAIYLRLADHAYGLLADASNLEGTGTQIHPIADRPAAVHAILERALALLQGNRSSTCVSYRLPTGQLRFVLYKRTAQLHHPDAVKSIRATVLGGA